MKIIFIALFLIMDVAAFFSVPKDTRIENRWALIPGGGYVLAVEYYFGREQEIKCF